MKLSENNEEISQAQEKLLKSLKGTDEWEMSWWRSRVDVIILLFKKFEGEEYKIVVEERSSLPSLVPAVEAYSARESAETMTLFWNGVKKQVLRDLLGCDPKRNVRICV